MNKIGRLKKYDFINKSFLIKEYVINKKTIPILRKETGSFVIYRRLKKFGIARRKSGKKKFFLNKKVLFDLYINKKQTLKEIGESFGCDGTCIRNNLINFKIPIRGRAEHFIGSGGKNHHNFKHGKYSLNDRPILYCIEPGCDNQVKEEGRRCRSCSKREDRNPCWRNGAGNFPYPSGFDKTLKEKIRKRDKYTCQLCGIIESKHLKLYKKVLFIHHIDHNRNNLDPNNLITLCNKCNPKVNFNVDYWTRVFQNILY